MRLSQKPLIITLSFQQPKGLQKPAIRCKNIKIFAKQKLQFVQLAYSMIK
jgi:hypothetical protein